MAASAPTRSQLIGRQQPMAELRRAVAAARDGSGSLVLVSGEPGIGKTRLAEEIAAEAADQGVPVLWGRCYEFEGRPPFWPWVQILDSFARRIGPERVAAEIDADTRPLAALAAEIQPHLPEVESVSLDADSGRFRLFQGISVLLRRAAAARPLLLVLDDLHWADLASLRLLDFLSHDLTGLPLVVVGTYRDVDIRDSVAASDVVGSLVRRARTITLAGFTRDEVAHFAAGIGSTRLSDASATRLHELTAGNPFFVDEMLRLLAARGGDLPAAGLTLPHGVQSAIRERLRALAPEVVTLLAEAAVVRGEFDLALLEAVLGESRTVLADRLRPALERDLVRFMPAAPGWFRFAHPLLQEAVGADLTAARRVELHRRCAEALEARHADAIDAHLTEIAHHYSEAALQGYDPKALEFAVRAGVHAMRALAFDEAASHFRRARGLSEQAPARDPGQHCELLLRLGEAANRAALGAEATEAFERAAALARQLGSAGQLARAAIGLCGIGSTWAQYGRSDPALIALLREALAGLTADAGSMRALVLARLATELHFAPQVVDTDALSGEAVLLARQTGDPATLASTLPARLRCSGPDQREERYGIIDELLALTGGRGELAVHAWVWKLSEALQSGVRADVDACRDALLGAVRALRQPRDLWLVPALQSQKHLCEGRLAEAEQGAEAVLQHESLSPNGQMTALVLLFLIRREQGRLGELADGMRRFAEQAATAMAWRTNLALLYAETGSEREARAEVDALVADGIPCLRRDNTWLLGAAGLAGATAAVGTPEQAAMVYRAMRPHAGRHVVAASFYYLGPVSYYLGLLALRQGLRDDAAAHLEAGIAEARGMAALPFVARGLLALATVPQIDPQAALAMRREAYRLAETQDLPAIRAAARAALSGQSTDADACTPAPGACLVKSGEIWTLTYRGRVSLLKPLRGTDYLVRLLAAPGCDVHVLDLTVGAMRSTGDTKATEALLDPRGKREIRERVEDLRLELQEAEANADLGRAASARAEIDAIAAHLAKSVGLRGRDRRVTGAPERARAAVTKAIRAAIRQIGRVEPDLADVLMRTVRTGAFCRYDPLAELPIIWTIDPGQV